MLDEGKRLLAVGAFCIGTNQIDLAHANQRGVPAFNAPFSNTRSVAELILAEIVMLSRQLGDRLREVHEGQWRKVAVGSHEVRGHTLGIVGYGHIGSQIGVLAEAFGMRVVFYDIRAKLPMGNNRAVAKLEDVLAQSGLRHAARARDAADQEHDRPAELAQMKRGACLLNASRGTVVHIDALAAAIQSGHARRRRGRRLSRGARVATATASSSVVRGLPNVILTPHIGGSTEEAQEAIGKEVAQRAQVRQTGHDHRRGELSAGRAAE